VAAGRLHLSCQSLRRLNTNAPNTCHPVSTTTGIKFQKEKAGDHLSFLAVLQACLPRTRLCLAFRWLFCFPMSPRLALNS
jgi:hypothetical protein